MASHANTLPYERELQDPAWCPADRAAEIVAHSPEWHCRQWAHSRPPTPFQGKGEVGSATTGCVTNAFGAQRVEVNPTRPSCPSPVPIPPDHSGVRAREGPARHH